MPHASPIQVKPEVQEKPSDRFEEKTFLPQESKEEPPFSAYTALKGEPYTIKYFGLEDLRFFIENPKFDSTLKDMVESIEGYIAQQIEKRKLTDSLESYREIIGELKRVLKIHPLMKEKEAFEKVAKYALRKYGIRRR